MGETAPEKENMREGPETAEAPGASVTAEASLPVENPALAAEGEEALPPEAPGEELDTTTPPRELLRIADSWRDMREWQQAAKAYEAFLWREPDAWGIMVQLGHCRKELGDGEGALLAYREAEQLAPDDADLQVQIGHVLKLSGDLEGAAAAYQAALDRDIGFAPAEAELAAVQALIEARDAEAAAVSGQGEAAAPAGAVAGAGPGAAAALDMVFDVTDVVDYFHAKRTPTGIQRVQTGMVSRLVAEAPPAGARVSLAVFIAAECHWRAVPAEAFATLAQLSSTGTSTADLAWVAAVAAVDRAIAEAPPLVFPQGALLVNLGNAFGFPEYFRGLRVIQQLHGVRYIPFVHDCVPLIVPEHCQDQMVRDYARWFGGVAAHAHGFLCNSESTRRDAMGQFNRLLPGLDLPSAVVPLDADFRVLAETAGSKAAEAAALAEMTALRPGENFVLFVSTVESRKNHQLVFGAWLQLLRRHGRFAVPRLVCVGKPGWHAEGALNLLAQSPDLKRHVLMLQDVSDQGLAALYGAASFTVYNSHYEGWGLPVTESLSYGKVPVVPEHSALPEAGGPGAVYFTPQNEPDLVEKLERMIFDAGFRQAREAAIAKGPPLRSWAQLKDQVLAEVAGLAAARGTALEARFNAELGRFYPVNNRQFPRPSRRQVMGELLRDGAGWYPAESWGVWSRDGYSRLRLPVGPEAAGAPLRLYLNLRVPPAAVTLQLGIATAEEVPVTHLVLSLVPGPDFTAVVELPALPETAALSIDLDTDKGVPLEDEARRSVGLGLTGYMLCRRDDLAARLDFVEAMRFQPSDAE